MHKNDIQKGKTPPTPVTPSWACTGCNELNFFEEFNRFEFRVFLQHTNTVCPTIDP